MPHPLFAADGPASRELKEAYLPVVDHNTCTSSGWWGSTVKTTMVCGGGNGVEAGCFVSDFNSRMVGWPYTQWCMNVCINGQKGGQYKAFWGTIIMLENISVVNLPLTIVRMYIFMKFSLLETV